MLELTGMSKQFGRHIAVSDISLRVEPGEIHGLVGLNGSGKSTLLNILSGAPVIRATGGYTGGIRINGNTVYPESPSEAFRLGIGMVHQEFSLFDRMTVAENIRLGREHVKSISRLPGLRDFAFPDKKKNIAGVSHLFQTMGLSLNPLTKVRDLPVSGKQFTEIAREIDKPDLSVLLLDEPAATLNSKDTETLVALVKTVAAAGVAVIYVSHALSEVTALCHRLTVMRSGKICARYDATEFDVDRITHSMVGQSVVQVCRTITKQDAEPVLSLKNVSSQIRGDRISNVCLEIHKGEILGIAGLSGHGKSAVGPTVMGLCPTSGVILHNGKPVRLNRPDVMVSDGVSLLSDDRKESLLYDHSVMENIVFSSLRMNGRFLKKGIPGMLGFTDRRKMVQYAEESVEKYHIQCRSVYQKAGELSGGNQQKLCFARLLSGDPEILFAGEPTRGIDMNAREVILEMLLQVNEEKGTTLVLASEELDEMKRICDRIAVFYQGEIACILSPDSNDKEFARAFSGETLCI